MKHVILDLMNANDRRKLINRLLEPFRLAVRGIRKTKRAGVGSSVRQPGVEQQAEANQARHLGEATAAILPTQFMR